jgi:hypothetical protein
MKKGMNKNMIMDIAGLAVGSVVASKVAQVKLPIALPPMVQAALPLILGVFLYKKPGILGAVAKGMIAAGSTKLIASVAPNLGIGTNEGIGQDDDISDYMIEGAENYSLAGYSLAGMNEGGGDYSLAGVDISDQHQNFG